MGLKIIALVIVLIVGVFATNAQDYEYDDRERNFELRERQRPSEYTKAYLVGNLNVAIPIGNYGSKSLIQFANFEPISFAQTGIDLNLNAGRFFLKWLGITTSIGYIRNNVDLSEVELAVKWFFASQIPPLLFENYSNKGFHHVYGTVGPVISYQTSKLAIDLRSQIGISYGIDAEESFEYGDGVATVFVMRDKGGFVGIMVQEGLSFRVSTGAATTLSLNIDYKYAKYKTEDTFEHHSSPNTITQTFPSNGYGLLGQDLLSKMHVISIGLGFGLAF